MAFGGKMYDAIDLVIDHKFIHCVKVAYITLEKRVVGFILNIFEIGQITGICEFIHVYDVVLGIFVHK